MFIARSIADACAAFFLGLMDAWQLFEIMKLDLYNFALRYHARRCSILAVPLHDAAVSGEQMLRHFLGENDATQDIQELVSAGCDMAGIWRHCGHWWAVIADGMNHEYLSVLQACSALPQRWVDIYDVFFLSKV